MTEFECNYPAGEWICDCCQNNRKLMEELESRAQQLLALLEASTRAKTPAVRLELYTAMRALLVGDDDD